MKLESGNLGSIVTLNLLILIKRDLDEGYI